MRRAPSRQWNARWRGSSARLPTASTDAEREGHSPRTVSDRSIRRGDTGADRTGHAGAAKPTITARVLGEILLMITLGEVELRRIENFRRDRAVALLADRLGIERLRSLCGPPLGRRRHING